MLQFFTFSLYSCGIFCVACLAFVASLLQLACHPISPLALWRGYFQMAIFKLCHRLKGYGNLAEWVDFAYWWHEGPP